LDTDKLELRNATAPFQAKLYYLTNTLHERVQTLRLNVTAFEGGNGRNIIHILVAFDEHGELSRLLHKADFSMGRNAGEGARDTGNASQGSAGQPRRLFRDMFRSDFRFCYAPSFSKNRQMVSMPRWKFGMWNFSLGAWRLSSGRPKPIITDGIFNTS